MAPKKVSKTVKKSVKKTPQSKKAVKKPVTKAIKKTIVKTSKKTSKQTSKKTSKKLPAKPVRKAVRARPEVGGFQNTSGPELEAIWEAFPDLTFRIKTDGTILDFSYGEAELIVSPERFLSKKFQEVMPERASEVIRNALKILREKNSPTSCEYWLEHSGSDRRHHYEARLAPLPGQEAVVFIRDITRQKRTEQELFERDQLFRKVFQNAPIFIFTTDPQGNFTMAEGKGFAEMEEANSSDLVGQNVFDFVEDYPGVEEDYRRALKGEEFTSVVRGILERIFEVRFSPLRGPEDEIVGVICVASDITERTLLEEELRQSQKMEVAGRLAGGIAHDFNNLLTIIMLNTDQLLEEYPIGNPTHNLVQVIDSAAERAADLTNRLLAFSRKQVIQPRVVNLGNILNELMGMLERLLGEDLDLKLMMGEGPYKLKIDPGQVEQIILNLGVNSMDAMPQGGRLAIKIDNVHLSEQYVRAHLDVEPGEYVLIAMSDTGHGMDRETLSHIFEPFFTTKEVGKGTGLGLSTVYGIVKQNKGHIDVSSEVGAGTIIQIYLPAAEEEVEESEVYDSQRRPVSGNETILLVEDEDDVRDSLRLILQRNSYKILEAKQGEDALVISELHDETIDLLVTDVVLPGMSGPQLADAVAERRPDMQVLYISGYPDTAIEEHGFPVGSVILQKPFKPHELVQKVRGFFEDEDEYGGAKKEESVSGIEGSEPAESLSPEESD